MSKLSVILITQNEEKNIIDCLESIQWADEIVIVDAKSSDKTVELASRYTDKVFLEEWRGYSEAKNLALNKVSNDWVLWLDADERVTPELADEIRRVVVADDKNVAGYNLARRAYFLGRWIKHCGWYHKRVIRLFRNNGIVFNESLVHEKLVIDGRIERLKNDLVHYTDDNLEHYFKKFNRYTSLASQDFVKRGGKFRITRLILDPPFEFLQMYVLKLGFLDGMEGFILSVLSASHVFTKYAKIWEQSKNKLPSSPKLR
jgi:glycosyltransferase involved in cell wall biosynthesis